MVAAATARPRQPDYMADEMHGRELLLPPAGDDSERGGADDSRDLELEEELLALCLGS